MQPNEIHEALIRAWGAIPVAIDLKPAVEMIVQEHLRQTPSVRSCFLSVQGDAYCIPLNHGMPSSAGGLSRCAPTDTAIRGTT